ncbi:tyrosine-protein kinase STK-like [Haliotis cracherodii]|uniref:tyrosine-protein kinase STK-like n=1 Tax=Haliotis cracherodii TaxID=6455 RepID=UPI0039EA9C4D
MGNKSGKREYTIDDDTASTVSSSSRKGHFIKPVGKRDQEVLKQYETRGEEQFPREPEQFAGRMEQFPRADQARRLSEQFPRGPEQFPRGPEQFTRGPEQIPRGPEHFSRGPEEFPRGPEQFPRGQEQFPRGPEQLSRGSEQFPRGPEQFSRGPEQFLRGPEQFPRGPEQFPRRQEQFPGVTDPSSKTTEYFPRTVEQLSGRKMTDSVEASSQMSSGYVSQSSSGASSQGVVATSSPSKASPKFQTPLTEHDNPLANHLIARRSRSVDHTLDPPQLSPQAIDSYNKGMNETSPISIPGFDRRLSQDEFGHNPLLKSLTQVKNRESPKLPPKLHSPKSSPKITRINVSGHSGASGMHRNFSSPKLARRATKRLPGQQLKLTKSFEDMQLIMPEMDNPTLPNETKPVIFLAMYDFEAINDDDLSFVKGDRLRKVNASDTADWVICSSLTNGKRGYIPVNYVKVDDNSPQAQDWWFDCSRHDGEAWLKREGVMTGSFLVRASADKNSYALSVRCLEPDGRTPSIRHYKIRKSADGQVYIGVRKLFPDVISLVEHYQKKEDGLVCRLGEPCPRTAPVTHLRSMEVSRENIRKTEKLGAGYFGEVWKGKLRGKLDIAIKMLKPGRMTVKEFIREARTMNKLRHVRLVQLLAVCTNCEPVLLITEYMANGSLLDFLRRDRRTKLEHTMMLNMTRQIAEGMAYLESRNFIHRDLRAGNILVGEHYDVKVADFGLARVVDDGQYVAGGTRFPIKWTAPEGVLFSKFSIKSDVWSFGILMYEIATSGKEPYAGMRPSEAVDEIQRGYRLPKPQEHWLPEQIDPYYLIMQQCWKYDPVTRPSFFHIHTLFEDFKVQMERDYGDV